MLDLKHPADPVMHGGCTSFVSRLLCDEASGILPTNHSIECHTQRDSVVTLLKRRSYCTTVNCGCSASLHWGYSSACRMFVGDTWGVGLLLVCRLA